MIFTVLRPITFGAISCAAFLGACTTTTTVEPFYRPRDAVVDAAYVSPSADFSRYSRLMGRPLEIYFPDNVPTPSDAELIRLRSVFREAFLTAIGDDYEIVDEAGPDVMLVIAQVVDMKVLGAGGSYEPSGRLREVVAQGQLTLLMEFQDSLSGRVLARAGEADYGSSTQATDAQASWSEVEAAAVRWAGLFKDFLDRNLR